MPKQNPLDELMEKFSSELKYKVPLGLIPEEEDKEFKNEGVEVALVLYWSYKHDLLNDNIKKLIEILLKTDKKLTHTKLLGVMKDTIGMVLESHMYNEKGKEFVVDYVAFTSQWKYQFYEDLSEIYPTLSSFSEIPQTTEAYETIFNLLDKRFLEYYQLEEKEIDENNEPIANNEDILPDDFMK